MRTLSWWVLLILAPVNAYRPVAKPVDGNAQFTDRKAPHSTLRARCVCISGVVGPARNSQFTIPFLPFASFGNSRRFRDRVSAENRIREQRIHQDRWGEGA